MIAVMLNKLLLQFVFCVVLLNVADGFVKRSETDLQTCIDSFDIHKDKIIRTQDSINMGAVYVNELDLGSREECLRLCCETSNCDVFVYEEKSPGSCYLFHCGPSEDFKCKFTRHANYSSAILTVNRHLNELESQIQLTKHVQDLTRLRKTESKPAQINAREEITTHQSLTTIKSVLKEVLPHAESNKTARKQCSRYQFECRTSGECIAIYNACDGIPQCADGSDEAVELGCPEQSTTVVPSVRPPPAPVPIIHNSVYEQNNQLRKPLPPLLGDNYQQRPASLEQQNLRLPLPVEISGGNSDYMHSAADIRSQSVNQPVIYGEPQVQQPYMPPNRPSSNSNSNWIVNHPPNQMPINAPNIQHEDKNSHIFNHKENGLQVVDSSDSGGNMQYSDINYPKLPNYYGEVYRQPYQVPENWQQNQPPVIAPGNPYLNNDNWQVGESPQTNIKVEQNFQQNTKTNWKQDLINTQAESKTYDHTIIREPKEFDYRSSSENNNKDFIKPNQEPVNGEKDNNHHSSKHKHAHISSAEELRQNVDNFLDGEAERPGGAILSLTLGIILTCIMAILIGCRLKVVRRRMRRGGKSQYAHDADYLVNGMYL